MSTVRLLASLVASLLLVASAVALDRGRTADGFGSPDAGPSPTATEGQDDPAVAPPSPSPTPEDDPRDADAALELLTSTDAAAAAGADELLAAGLVVAQGPWRTLTTPEWPVRQERPVYVAEATITDDGTRIDADVVIAWRQAEDVDRLVLRALPASTVLQAAGGALATTVSVNGTEVEFDEDGDGARIVVPLPLEADSTHLLRVGIGYDLVDGAALSGRGGPAGFGILARNAATETRPDTANLGHWLPLLTFDPEPMVEWGDVGAFPTAIWSVLVDHPGALVTGGEDGTCPEERPAEQTCTWSRGVALRDVSGVWFDAAPPTVTERVGSLEVNAVVPAGTFPPGTARQALLESAGSAQVFTQAFGPLAWREFDVVAAPLLEGAAGMEFPGLVIIDLDIFGNLNGQAGTYVIAHEVGHQWFHALVGNGSLSSPVVDESLAQYLSYLFWVQAYGEEAASNFAREAIRGRYDAARQRGLEDEPPAQPLAEFESDAAYGPLVYARGALAWLAAEERIGREALIEFLAQVVATHGLGEVSDDELLAEAEAFDVGLGGLLERYWFDPAPLSNDAS